MPPALRSPAWRALCVWQGPTTHTPLLVPPPLLQDVPTEDELLEMAAELACEMELAGVGGWPAWPAPQHAGAAERASSAHWPGAAVLAALVGASGGGVPAAPWPNTGGSAGREQGSATLCPAADPAGAVPMHSVFGASWPVLPREGALPPRSPGAADVPAMPSLVPLDSGATTFVPSWPLAPVGSPSSSAGAATAGSRSASRSGLHSLFSLQDDSAARSMLLPSTFGLPCAPLF